MTATNNPHIQRLVLAKPYIGRLSLGFFFMLLTIGVDLMFPKAIAYLIDNIDKDFPESWLHWGALGLFFLFAFQAIAIAARGYLFESTGNMIVTELRRKLYRAILVRDIEFFEHQRVGELCNRLSLDVQSLHNVLSMELVLALRSAFVCVGGVVLLIFLSPQLSLLIVFVIPVSMICAKWIGRNMEHYSKLQQETLAKCGNIAQENFSNIRLLHAFNQQQQANNQYQHGTQESLDCALTNSRIFSGFQGLVSFIRYTALVAILWFGARLILSHQMSVGELTSFVLYTGMVATSATVLSSFWGSWMRSIGATEQVFALLNAASRQMEAGRNTPNIKSKMPSPRQLHGNIRFDNVSFSYPSRPNISVLNHFELTISPGEKVALVGSSGAGKSTISSLLLGFYTPTKGRICFDEFPVKEMDIRDVRANIAVVEQEPVLFTGTIFENILFGSTRGDESPERVYEAARLAYADEFIRELPDGYDTHIGQRGVQLSGGQKQRIAIARAILRDAKILILDEVTSALDSESEYQVQKALDSLMEGRTTIIITHRFTTIHKADRIIVMNGGRIVEQGGHEVLSNNVNGLYSQLMKKQLPESNSIPEC